MRNYALFTLLAALAVAGAMGAQDGRYSLAAQERRMDRMDDRIIQNQQEIADLKGHVALLPFIVKEQAAIKKTIDDQFAWNIRGLVSIVAILLAILGFLLQPHFHHRKHNASHPAGH